MRLVTTMAVLADGQAAVFAVGAVGRPSVWTGDTVVTNQGRVLTVVVVADPVPTVVVVADPVPTVVVTEANQPIGVSSSGKTTYAVSVEGSERRVKVSQ
jgi:hypothetical protein